MELQTSTLIRPRTRGFQDRVLSSATADWCSPNAAVIQSGYVKTINNESLIETQDDVCCALPLTASRCFLAASCRLVFEDAPAGIQAGNAAGAKVVAVATTLEEQDLEDQFWIRNFTSLRVGIAADGLLHVASARQITL